MKLAATRQAMFNFRSTYTTPVSPHAWAMWVMIINVLVDESVLISVNVPKSLAVDGCTVTTGVDVYVAVLVGTITCLVVVLQPSYGRALGRALAMPANKGTKAKQERMATTDRVSSYPERVLRGRDETDLTNSAWPDRTLWSVNRIPGLRRGCICIGSEWTWYRARARRKA